MTASNGAAVILAPVVDLRTLREGTQGGRLSPTDLWRRLRTIVPRQPTATREILEVAERTLPEELRRVKNEETWDNFISQTLAQKTIPPCSHGRRRWPQRRWKRWRRSRRMPPRERKEVLSRSTEYPSQMSRSALSAPATLYRAPQNNKKRW